MKTAREEMESEIEDLIKGLKSSPLSEKNDYSLKLANASVKYKQITGQYYIIKDTAMGNFD